MPEVRLHADRPVVADGLGAAVHAFRQWSRIHPATGREGYVPVAFVFTGKTEAQRASRLRRLERPPASMPAMICDIAPEPELSSTLPTSRSASGATPRSLPPDAAPVPATVEAVWVP
ncbi:hypothetical protein ACZ91_19535 [Streptomyces regensis]|nr:hypothetical protein ACZ91_19535 [Streptomyces regensis]